MREVAIYNHPVTVPGVCGKCGSQDKDWFVDLGFDTIFNQEPDEAGSPIWTDGTVYLCSDCYNSLVTDVNRRFKQFLTDVPVTHLTYTLPVGSDEDFSELVQSKLPVEEEDDGESEPESAFGIDLEADDSDGENDGESESTDSSSGTEDQPAVALDGPTFGS